MYIALCSLKMQQITNYIFILHINIISTVNPRVCPTCGKKYKTKKDFELHVEQHNIVKPFECDVCKKCFAGERSLKYHYRTHTKEKRYKINKKCGWGLTITFQS